MTYRSFAAAMRELPDSMLYTERVALRQHLIDAYHAMPAEVQARFDLVYLTECAGQAYGVLWSTEAILVMSYEELLRWHPSVLSFESR